MRSLTGRKLGRYELLERLGHGSMAEVYKAFQPGVDGFVASKILHSHRAESDDFVARFQREARAIERLKHPNIVGSVDFGIEDGTHYMVMDYIAGGTLSDYLKQHHCLPVAEALAIGVQLAEALDHAHQQGMIHRDIKPSNVMFVDNTHSQVMLTDFGLARLRDDATALTLSGSLIGTPTYMSPEAVRGEACDKRADLYSLGVVLYELVTGKTPYTANTPYSMMMKQTNEPLPSPCTLNSTLPTAVEHLLLKALAKDPADRYQSAAEFAQAIRQTQDSLQQEPAVASQEEAVATAGPEPTKRHRKRWLSLMLTASLVLLITFLVAQLLLSL